MNWLTWRQFRISALTVFGVLGAVALALALTGPRLYREVADLLTKCANSPGVSGGGRGGISAVCSEGFDEFFLPRAGVYFGLILLVIALPAVVGMFWGAPLISRELETGTQDLVWQQSVPRRRWLAAKLGIVGLAAIAAAALAVVPVSWWSRPLDATSFGGINRMTPILFDARGYVVVGHAAFAFTLGVAAGLLIRRTLPAMAVTFAIFVAVQIVMPTMVRPHLATPERLEVVITAENLNDLDASGPGGIVRGLRVLAGPPDAWILSSETVDAAGRTVDTLPGWVAACALPQVESEVDTQRQCLERLTTEGYRQVVTFHPAGRFWPFQAYETAIFGMLSLLLVGFCFLRIRPT